MSSNGVDLGVLFHAREHPKEFTNRMGPVLPVCSPESGGARDPRRGTLLSIQDPSFQDRNFLWLLSLNACFRINLRRCASVAAQGTSREVHSEFSKLLAPGASGSCFFTVDEANFGTQLGTICYLPKDHDPAVPFHWQDGPGLSDLLCIPCHGFPSDWHLARALKQQDEEEAVRSLATIDAELLALLKHDETHESRRCLRLGSARRRRQLLSFAEAEQLGVKTAEVMRSLQLKIYGVNLFDALRSCVLLTSEGRPYFSREAEVKPPQ